MACASRSARAAERSARASSPRSTSNRQSNVGADRSAPTALTAFTRTHADGEESRSTVDYAGLPRLQGADVPHREESAERSGPSGAPEVLPALPQAHGAPR